MIGIHAIDLPFLNSFFCSVSFLVINVPLTALSGVLFRTGVGHFGIDGSVCGSNLVMWIKNKKYYLIFSDSKIVASSIFSLTFLVTPLGFLGYLHLQPFPFPSKNLFASRSRSLLFYDYLMKNFPYLTTVRDPKGDPFSFYIFNFSRK